jgi:TRAP-type C4-dicarboxylate transport system substrate-binding protein
MKQSVGRIGKLILVAIMALAFSVTMAQAKELKIVSGDGPQHDGVKAFNDIAKWIEEESNGELTARVFPQVLLKHKEIPPGIRDGVADMGLIVHPYFPAEFSEAAFIADFSLFATNNFAAAGAATEYMMNCEDCMVEMGDFGHIYLGNIANAPYSLLAKDEIVSMADIKGKKIRSGGAAWGRWIEAMGGVKVSIPASEAYQALSQGMLDAHTHSIGSLIDQGLADVVNYVIDIPLGVYFGASINFSAKSWKELSAGQQKVIFELAPYMLARYVAGLRASTDKVRNELDKLKITLKQPNADLTEASQTFLKNDIAMVAELGVKNYGLSNTNEKAEKFLELLAKWEKLTADMPTDYKTLGDLYKKEIFSKLDMEKLYK